MSVPGVTVVIPTRERAHVLPTAIESVLGQEDADLRLLVCDNASRDATPEVVSRYAARDPRVSYHRHPQDVGATANFQWGMDAVETEHFVLLSDDDADQNVMPRRDASCPHRCPQRPGRSSTGRTSRTSRP